mgnify:CR=1 FL=1
MTLNNKSILLTGGTGSFGVAFVKRILKLYPKIKRLVIFSRDELKQEQMRNQFSEKKHNNLRFFLGDVRDYQRLLRAVEGIEIIVHAAALKQVPAAEYNPIEFIKTNIIGAQNIIEASIEKKIKKVIALSSDKAAAPVNLYGATKLCSDKLFIAANNYAGKNSSFSVVRYGNVMGSRGSIIPKLIDQAKTGVLNITDKRMTRFSITLDDSVDMVLFAIKNTYGSEILVPKIPSYNIMDLAKAIGPSCRIKNVGIRAGEKIHEEMITESDSLTTYDIGKYFLILPNMNKKIVEYYKKFKVKPVKFGFSYNSGRNKKFLSTKEIKDLIKKNISIKK